MQYAAFVHHGLASSVVENLFNQVDKNKDGYLTSIEFNDIRPLVLAKAENAALRYLNVCQSFSFLTSNLIKIFNFSECRLESQRTTQSSRSTSLHLERIRYKQS